MRYIRHRGYPGKGIMESDLYNPYIANHNCNSQHILPHLFVFDLREKRLIILMGKRRLLLCLVCLTGVS